MTSPALWLAARELATRRRSAALAAAVVASLATATTSTELLARAREEAVAARIDGIGPSIVIAPRGTTPGALARYELGPALLPPAASGAASAALGSDLRALEGRLVLARTIAGVRAPIVGLERQALPAPLSPAAADSLVLGSELGRRIGSASSIALDGREYRVAGALPSSGSAEDLAAFLPIESAWQLAGATGLNELLVFLRAGVAPREAEQRLARALPDAAVIRIDRGEVADRAAHASLVQHRTLAYAVMALVAALCLAIAAHLDASERRTELATLIAIGASRWTVLGSLLLRSATVASGGAAIGVVAGAALAAGQDPSVAAGLARGWGFATAALLGALAVGVVAAAPTAVACTVRDPVADLQEGA